MKNIFLSLCFLCCATIAFSQSSSHFKYQGVARDANQQAFVNTALGLKISIVLDNGSGSGSGLVQYSEKHLAFTSSVGVFSLNIGDGQATFGDIEEINWGSGTYWLKVEMDINGGEDYVYMGNSPIVPVPIAIHALTVSDKDDADADPDNEIQNISFDPNTNQLSISGGNTINIPAGQADADADPNNEIQTLQFNANNNTLSLTNGGQVNLSSLAGGNGGTDDQNLQLNGTTLSIEGGNQVNLAVIQDGTEDADANPQNELQTISFDPNTNQLTISEGNSINIPAGQADADADPNNEIQTLLLNGTTLSIEGGNNVNLATIQDGTEDADANPQNELQTISFDPNTNQLTISEGNSINIPAGQADADADPQNEIQSLLLNGTILTIEGANNVNLATIQDGTEDADADPTNEIQILQFDANNNMLSLSDGGQVDLSSLEGGDGGTDDQTLELNGTTLSIEGGNNVDLATIQDGTEDADANPTNEIQVLQFDANSNTLSLSDGGQVDLSSLEGGNGGTDDQTLELNGTTLFIEGGNNVDLATIQDGTEDADADPNNEIQNLQLNGTTLTIDGGNNVNLAAIQDGTEDADANPTNEIQILQFDANSNTLSLSDGGQVDLSSLEGGNGGTDDQTLQLNGTTLSIEGGNNVDLASIQDGTEDADANPNNELQTLSFNANTNELSLSSGNTVNLPIDVDDNDHSPTNELQTISLNGNNLTLSQGGQVDLSGLGGGSSLWLQAPDNDLYTQESVAIGFANSQLSTLEVKEDITIRKSNGNIVHDFFSNSTGGHMYLYKGNGTGGSNDLLVNIDAAQSGGLINLRNSDGNIRGEFSIGSSTNSLFLNAPDGDDAFDVVTSNTSTFLTMNMPNGSTGIELGVSAFGGNATFNGSTGSDVAFIGRSGGSPTSGKVTIGNSSNGQMVDMHVSSGDAGGTRAGWIDGYTSSGDQIFRLGSLIDAASRGYLGIFDDNGNEAVSVRGSQGGEIILRGFISKNVIVGTTSSSSDLGKISVYDALDTESAGLYTDFSGNGIMFADVKNFRMDHPVDDTKEIWYACVEGPEAAAYERGTASLVNGEAVVNFPDHFGLVANHETMTVMLTPLSADCKGLAVVEKTATGFKVKELFQGVGTYSFDWEVKCVRKGYENYEPIREKKDRL